MKFLKIWALIVMAAVAVASAHAAVDAKMDIFPTNNIAEPGEDFLVFGYIYSDDIIDDSDIKLKIYDDNDNLVDTISPRFSALSGSDSGRNGYFYSMVDVDKSGKYEIKLRVNGATEATQNINIKNIGGREAEITDFDYSISNDRITFYIEVENRDDKDRDITVQLKGEKNFDNPKTFTINDVEAGGKEDVTKTYSLSDFGNSNFLVAAQARTDSGNDEAYSEPEYLFVENAGEYVYGYYQYDYNYGYSYPASYSYGNVIITGIELDTTVFYPGDIVEGKVYIKNVGSGEAQYRFEYSYDNQLYRAGDAGYVLAGETDEQDIVIKIPDADSFRFTAKDTSGTVDTEVRTYMVSHRLKYFSSYFSDNEIFVNAGENATVTLTVKNRGNEDDSYRIKISGWSFYKLEPESFALVAGAEKIIPLSITVPKTSKIGIYPIIVDIENSNGMHRSVTLRLSITKPMSEQSEVVFKDELANAYFEENETITYSIKVSNKEADEKDYFVEAEADGVKFEIIPESFALDNGDSKEITISATPSEKKDYTIRFSVYSNGEKIFSRESALNYTENKERAISGITGFAVFQGKAWMPAVYLLALIGMVTIGYFGYRLISEKANTEKIVQYNKTMQMPEAKTQAPVNLQMSVQAQQPLQTKPEYPEDSFMRRF